MSVGPNYHNKQVFCDFQDGHSAKVTSSNEESTQADLLSRFESGTIMSGVSALSASHASLSTDLLELNLSDNINLDTDIVANPTVGSSSLVASYPPRTGTRTVIVLRVITGGGTQFPPSDETKISDKWFGTSGDAINNESQFKACSGNQLIFEPFIGTTNSGVYIANGVYTITVSADQYNPSAVDAEAKIKGSVALGDLQSQFDHVVLSVPDNNETYAAYAAVNSWSSLFKDVYIDHVTIQMHELGHNLGLHHSSEGEEEYGDNSGVMGVMWDDDRNICFNGPKIAQLGWFPDREVDVDISTGYTGNVYGIADYETTGANDKMILQIVTVLGHDYYVTFNKATGINAETGEGANQVLVHSRPAGNGFTRSFLLAKLSAGETFNDAALSVEVLSIGDYATLSVSRAKGCIPSGTCGNVGEQYCCKNMPDKFVTCVWETYPTLKTVEKSVSPGTQCCKHPAGNFIIQQDPNISCTY